MAVTQKSLFLKSSRALEVVSRRLQPRYFRSRVFLYWRHSAPFVTCVLQVAAQGSVPHSGVAMATAVVLLWTEIGGAVGSAIGKWKFDVSGVEAHPVRRSRRYLAEPDA